MARTEAEFNIVARDKTKRGFDSATKRARSAADNITRAARVAGGALAVFGGTRAIRGALRATAQIDEMGDVAGVSAERIQELTKSFSDMAGVSESVSQGGLRRFNRRLDLARDGTGAAKDTLDKLNITLEQDTESALNQSIARLQEMAKTQNIVGEASQLFGEDAGPKMAAALAQGEEALRNQIRELREHGRVLSDETAANAREANDELNALSDRLSTQFANRIAENAEAIESVATALANVAEFSVKALGSFSDFSEFIGEELASEINGAAGDDIPRLQEEIEELESTLSRLQKTSRGRGPGGPSEEQQRRIEQIQSEIDVREKQIERTREARSETEKNTDKTEENTEANRQATQIANKLSSEVKVIGEELQGVTEQRSAELLAEQIEQIRRTVDPTRAGLLELGDNLDALSRSELPTDQVEQLKVGLVDAADGGSKLVEAFDAVEQAADERIRELGQDVAGDAGEDAGDEFASGFERQAERIGDSLADALISGDFEGVGSAVAGAVGGAIGDSVTGLVGDALGSFAGSSAISGAAGGVVGGLAGQLVGDLFGGGSKEITKQLNFAIEDAIVTGFEQVTIETDDLFGSSTSTAFNELGREVTEAVENSFERTTRDIGSTLDSLGVDFEKASENFQFALEDTNPSEFVEEAANSFLEESTVVAEVFREAGETLVDSINRVAENVQVATQALDPIDANLSDLSSNLADEIESNLNDQIDNVRNSIEGVISDINELANSPKSRQTLSGTETIPAPDNLPFVEGLKDVEDLLERGREGFFSINRANVVKSLADEIRDFNGDIDELQDRIDEVESIALAQFSENLISSVSELENISTEEAKQNIGGLAESLEDLRFTEAEQAQRTIDDARESLERFSDIGIDASASVEKITQQLSEFNPTTAEQTASLLVAAGAVEDLQNATDKLSDSAEDAADTVARTAADQRKIDQARQSRTALLRRDETAQEQIERINEQIDATIRSQSALDEFVQSLDLTTESGRDAFDQVQPLAGAINDVANESQNASSQIQRVTDQLQNIADIELAGDAAAGLNTVLESELSDILDSRNIGRPIGEPRIPEVEEIQDAFTGTLDAIKDLPKEFADLNADQFTSFVEQFAGDDGTILNRLLPILSDVQASDVSSREDVSQNTRDVLENIFDQIFDTTSEPFKDILDDIQTLRENAQDGVIPDELVDSDNDIFSQIKDLAESNEDFDGSRLTSLVEDIISAGEQIQESNINPAIEQARQARDEFLKRGESASERIDRINDTLDASIESQSGLNDFVEGLNLTTESGREAFEQAQPLAQALRDVAQAEQQAAQAARQARESRTQFLRRDEGAEAQIERINDALDASIGSQSGLNEFVRGLNLTTEAGREAFQQVQPLAQALRELADAERQAQQQIDQARQSRTEFLRRDETAEARINRLNERLDAPAIESQSALNKFVQSLDLTTEAGREAFKQAQPLAQALQQVADAEEQRLDSVKSATDEALSSLRDSVDEQIEEIRERREKLENNLSGATGETDAILSDIQSITDARKDSINEELEREKEAIRERENSQLESISNSLDAEQERLSRVETLFDAASSALDNLMPDITDDAISFERAMGRVRSAVQSGGIGVEDDLQRISEIDAGRFGGRVEFERTQGQAANLLSQAQEEAGERKTAAERQLEALESQKQAVERSAERQIEEAESNAEDQIRRLDSIVERAQDQIDEARGAREELTNLNTATDALNTSISEENALRREIEQANFEQRTEDLNQIVTNAEDQLNELRGINDNFSNLAKAIENFETARDNEADASGVSNPPTSSIDETLKSAIRSQSDAIDRDLTVGSGQFFRLPNGDTLPESRIESSTTDELRNIAEATGVSGFADGGTFSGGLRVVGERGPEIEATGPSRIMSNANLMQSLGASKEMLAELRQLRNEIRQGLSQVAKNTDKSSKQLDRFNFDGIPIRTDADEDIVST